MKYKSIYELDLSGNKIRTLPKSISFLKNLEVLDLSGNPIQNVSKASFPFRDYSFET
jgi:Leucine-rich repeat (LRR) protein